MVVIDGKKIASEINEDAKKEVEKLKAKYNQSPCLATVVVGKDESSKIYVQKREKMCEKIGIASRICDLPENSKEDDVLEMIGKLNNDENVHGIIVQLPLPKHINEKNVSETISPEKDVDCMNPANLGRLASNDETFAPCTPKAVITILEKSGIKIRGKDVVIVGRSRIVGRPLALMLINRDATVTVCHTKTKNLEKHTKNADILVAAAGSPMLIKNEMVKENAVVVDIGINVVNNNIVGDVDFENIKNKASFITPVPGGVGPVTVAMIMKNTLEAFKRSKM
ncbi:MAG: bifunctional methylenetetrahydrofolate dehydrogenase/methenyltetrahydrofolate cyclohydrolase FolD [Candidatus Thermoplasmatota archaeon]|nr:bifunctional methylenetetrahydrofolate dehydrogenase/methenyltetrahydrofolate cyclohydrolase FolD [Candidatus Thermoplasmatota archaeon]MBU4256055.1 bifunctional methylenetetrahydrofolate dehydrogenase/methenyltetrahydrofolate cyclohydrolase FolD [Candidatus Thermoplasmatota archaeon]